MTSAADLFGLQEIDLSRDSRRALIADIESRLGETEDLIAARDLLQTASSEVDSLRRQQRELDTQLRDLDAKITPLETRLYGGSVRNAKELTDLQKEVDSFKHRRGVLDDQGLGLIESIEVATLDLDRAKQRLVEIEAAWRQDVAELRETRERAQRESARLEQERALRVDGMDPKVLGLYDSLRPKKAGRPVARVERGTCQGCRLSLPTHIAQRARSALAIVQCPSCERILVAG